MSDVKRVTLTTISNSVSSFGSGTTGAGGSGLISSATAAAANLRFGSDFATAQNKSEATVERKGCNKTVRLSLELFATDSSTYPEFNYSKLLRLEKKKIKKLKQKSNGHTADPFEENDDDVERIAKELEKKYGSTYGSGRGRSKKDDHCDIGLGYDESDSFIDNTEAYDEVIPEEVETFEGGFYINCGALEFKKLHTESTTTKTDEIIKMPNRPKKRVLSSSESSSSSEDDEEGDSEEEAVEVETNGKDVKANTASGPADKRPKTTATTKNASGSGNSKKRDNANGNAKKKDKPIGGLTFSSSNSPKPVLVEEVAGSDSEKERSRQKTIKTTTVKDMLKAKRDSFLKMQEGGEAKSQNGELKAAPTKYSDDESSSDDSEASDANSDSNQSAQPAEKNLKKSEESSEKLRSSDTKLPELDADVIANIQEFKETVKSKNMNGKRFVFDEKLTDIFLKIDEASLCIEKPQRNMVFAHLEYQLSLPKYFFLRKAKQLRIKEEKLKSKRALANLRQSIVEVMPSAIANYEVELHKFADLQSNVLNAENPPKMPKKKFTWNDNMRNLLYEVYQVRWTSYPVLGTRKESLEDFISTYMKGKVVQLWPNGWMRYEDLQKEIEKRKAATKKIKEKKKDTTTDLSANRAVSTAQTAATTTTATTTTTVAATYIKQFEEFAVGGNGSRANSDTDSVASSGQSSGIKRKNKEHGKQNKSKALKTIGEVAKHFIQSTNNSNNESFKTLPLQSPPSPIIVDISSPSKRTDHSIHSIISSTSTSPTPTATTALTKSQQKHSGPTFSGPPAHVINLDNYKSASDILMTSQQLLGKSKIGTSVDLASRESSSESDCVEFVGVIETSKRVSHAIGKNKHKKNVIGSNQNSRSATPTLSGLNLDSLRNATATNNNNNSYLKVSNIKSNKVMKELEQELLYRKAAISAPSNASGKEINQ